MKTVTPLKAGDHGPEVANLLDALHLLIDRGKLSIDRRDAFLSSLEADRTKQLYNADVGTLVRMFQVQHQLAPSGEVDAKTTDALNAILKELGAINVVACSQFKVNGHVKRADGTPAARVVVSAADRDLREEQPLGKTRTDESGLYEIAYTSDQFARAEKGSADLIVRVLDDQGKKLAESPIQFNVGPQATVDLLLPPETAQVSEFERYLATITFLLQGQGVALKELNSSDIDFIVGDTGISQQRVSWLVLAAAWSADITLPAGPVSATPPSPDPIVPPSLFYGWFREGLPTDVAALSVLPRSSFESATQTAVAANIIPANVAQNLSTVLDQWDAYRGVHALNAHVAAIGISGTQLLDALGSSISTEGRARLTVIAGTYGGLNGPALQAASNDSALKSSKDLAVLMRGLSFTTIADNHAPLVAALDKLAAGRTDITSAKDLVRLGNADWLAIAKSAGVPGAGLPPTDAQIQDYANTLRLRVEDQYLADAAAYRIGTGEIPLPDDISDGVKKLMAADPRITLGSSQGPPLIALQQTTILQGVTNLAQVKDEVLAVDRILRLVGNTRDAADLLRAGYRSATDIVNAGRSAFVNSMTSGDGSGSSKWQAEKTSQTFAEAVKTEQAATFLLAGRLVNVKRPPIQALTPPNPDPGEPTLSDFLGGSTSCACEGCSSVLSPSAYLADILAFLEHNQLLDSLLAQRPDLQEIVLDCANAETEIPYVDLVIEILERAIVEGAANEPLQSRPQLSIGSTNRDIGLLNSGQFPPDLKQQLESAGITLTAEAVVTTGPSSTWYVRDRGWTLQIWYDPRGGGVFKVTPWPQTGTDSQSERAWPEHQFPGAYSLLATAVYPWTLPFDLAFEQSRSALLPVGLSREMLLQFFSSGNEDARNTAVALERLKLTAKELADLDTAAALNEAQIAQLWGFDDVNVSMDDPSPQYDGSTNRPKLTGWKAIAARASFFLTVTGLSFAEMQELLESRFVAGTTPFALVSADTNDPYTCDPRKLNISGLSGQDTAVLIQRFLAIYRFVRLARATQLSFGELDVLLSAFPASDWKTILINVSNALAVKGQLHLTSQEAAALWADLDTHGFNQYTGGKLNAVPSLYAKVFRSQPDTASVFPEDASQFGSMTFTALVAPLSACLGFEQRLVTQWLQIAGVIPANSTDLGLNVTLGALSGLYRHLKLAQSLNLSADDYQTAVALLGDPGGSPALTQIFLKRLTNLQSYGLSLETLDYLLRYRSRSSTAERDVAIALSLEALRRDLAGLWVPPVPQDGKIDANIEALAQSVSRSTGADPGITRSLLTTYLHVPADRASTSHRTLATYFLDHASWPTDDTSAISRASAVELMRAFELVLMSLQILTGLNATQSSLSWIFAYAGTDHWLNPDALPLDPSDPAVPAPQYERLAAWLRYDGTIFAGSQSLAAFFAALADTTATKASVISIVAMALQADPGELIPLLGQTDNAGGLWTVAFRDAYWDPSLMERLRISGLIATRLGLGMAVVATWAGQPSSAAFVARLKTARQIEHAVRSVIGATQWERWAAQSDLSLREKRRQALVAYLLQRDNLPDSSALCGQYLIDVEMSPCQITTRVAQAIFSAQLFVQRVQLNLVTGAAFPSEEALTEWNTWRKWYRVWQANREIFLYPENWLEPELRDDKSQIFQEFETNLMQSDLTSDSATQAFGNYLEKFGQITRLEVVSILDTVQADTTVTHIVARTRFGPATYYYRTRTKRLLSTSSPVFALSWTAWEKIDTDITGDFVIPVVYGKRVDLVWPIITEKSADDGSDATNWGLQFARTRRTTAGWKAKETVGAPFIQPQLPAKSASESFVFRTAVEDKLTRVLCFAGEEVQSTLPWTDSSRASGPAVLKVNVNIHLFYKDKPTWGIPNMGVALQLPGLTLPLIALTDPSGVASFRVDVPITGEALIMIRKPGDNNQVSWATHPGVSPMFDYTINSQNNAVALLKLDSSSYWQYDLVLEAIDIEAPEKAADPNRPLNWVQVAELVYEASGHAELSETTSDLTFGGPTKSFPYGMGYTLQRTPPTTDVFLSGNSAASPVFTSRSSKDMITVFGNVCGTGLSGLGMFYSPDIDADFFQPLAVNSTGGSYVADASQTPLYLGGVLTKVELHALHYPRASWVLSLWHDDDLEKLAQPDLNSGGNSQDLETTISAASGSSLTSIFDPEGIEFDYSHAGAIYNWEIFFHIPFLIAVRLNQNQRFGDAQQWFHRIFNPISPVNGSSGPERFWRIRPFRDALEKPHTLADLLADASELQQQVAEWEANPFMPHMLARSRTVPYMIAAFMRYIENLVDWGDQLFRRETLEAINEATQYYVLASQLLGPRPQQAYRSVGIEPASFDRLSDFDALNNPIATLSGIVGNGTAGGLGSSAPRFDLRYFCIPSNDRLSAHWDRVEDRLFKVRHCLNLEGGALETSLFGPPIDPGLLVQAVAAGLDISTILDNSVEGSHPYRFSVLIQKANELCTEVKSLGSALLSALEKQDGEDLTLLRAGHEKALLILVKDVRQKQLDEANASLTALRASRAVAMERLSNYRRLLGEDTLPLPAEGSPVQRVASTLQKGITSASVPIPTPIPGVVGIVPVPIPGSNLGLSLLEQSQLLSSVVGTGLSVAATVVKLASSVSHALPDVIAGASVGVSAQQESGGSHVGFALDAVAAGLEGTAHTAEQIAGILSVLGSHERRRDDWAMQHNLTAADIEQLDKQIIAATIRSAIAQNELDNQTKQIEQSTQVEEFLHSKFSNRDLYHWMLAQISGTYFRTYQLATQMARAAQRAYQRELAVDEIASDFIGQGYWNTLKQGLLAGENLALDLKRMEFAYLENDKREYELTKNVSLLQLDPLQVMALRETGTCTFTLPEVLFDLDFPGHYLRRIRSVSVTVPCVVGPYSSVSGTLTWQGGKVRKRPSTDESDPTAKGPTETPFPFVGSIATSTGQADSGLFEFNFRDERYLPFEGAGAVDSEWQFSLPQDFRTFDYNTISDFILHIRYTARGDQGFAVAVHDQLKAQLNQISAHSQTSGLWKVVSMRTEFPMQWNRLRNAPLDPISLVLTNNRFPMFLRDSTLQVVSLAGLVLLQESAKAPVAIVAHIQSGSVSVDLDQWSPMSMSAGSRFLQSDAKASPVTIMHEGTEFRIACDGGSNPAGSKQPLDMSAFDDLMIALQYQVS